MKILGKKIADIGYYINLNESTDRKENVEKQINDFKIEDLNRLSALTDDMRQSSATKSHRKIFELCRENNVERVVVLEDDFQLFDEVCVGLRTLSKPLAEYLDGLIEEMESIEWDVILLGFNGRKIAIPFSKNFSIPFSCTGGWGYIIKKSAYEFILDNYDYGRDRMAIDDILPSLNYRNLRTLATNVQVVHHGVGFISTLNPSGPVNYTDWINGNYYNSIWRHIKEFGSITTFDEALNLIYENSKFFRENLIVFKNFPKDPGKIESYIRTNEIYKNCLVLLNYDELSHEEMRMINYHFVSESSLLVNWTINLQNIKKYFQNIVEVDLSFLD